MTFSNVNELKKIILHAPGNIFLKDCFGRYLLCNDNQLKVAGVSSLEDIINKTDYDLYSKDIADQIKKIDESILQSKVEHIVEEIGVDVHGHPAVYLTRKIPLFDENGAIYGILGISLDITERKNNERLQVEKAKTEQILAEMQAKLDGMTQVSACIAHELRTPLATISMGLHNIKKYFPLLRDAYNEASQANLPIPKINAQIFKLLGDVPASLERVTQSAFLFIDMLLMNLEPDFKPATEHTTFMINQCIAKGLETYPCTEQEKTLIHWAEDANHDFVVRGKMLLVKHILYNLIKNSLYYIAKAEKGEIHIWTQKGQKYNTLYFKDTGPGIASELVPKIFDRFFTQSEYGAGIGLTYCKMVMESLDGVIHCDSREGEYTLFRLEFPVI